MHEFIGDFFRDSRASYIDHIEGKYDVSVFVLLEFLGVDPPFALIFLVFVPVFEVGGPAVTTLIWARTTPKRVYCMGYEGKHTAHFDPTPPFKTDIGSLR